MQVNIDGALLSGILSFLLQEQLSGRNPTFLDIATKFDLTIERSKEVMQILTAFGEVKGQIIE